MAWSPSNLSYPKPGTTGPWPPAPGGVVRPGAVIVYFPSEGDEPSAGLMCHCIWRRDKQPIRGRHINSEQWSPSGIPSQPRGCAPELGLGGLAGHQSHITHQRMGVSRLVGRNVGHRYHPWGVLTFCVRSSFFGEGWILRLEVLAPFIFRTMVYLKDRLSKFKTALPLLAYGYSTPFHLSLEYQQEVL